MTLLHKTLRKLLPWHYSFSIHQLLLTISVPFVCCRYLGWELSEAKPVTLYAHVASHPVTSVRELSALKYSITHNLRSRISSAMFQSFILSLQMLHIAVNKLRDHQTPVIYYTTVPDVLSKRTCKNQKAILHL